MFAKLNKLIEEENHEGILELESPTYDSFKTVACIMLGRYRDAMLYTKGNSFHKAYCFYKLKKYKRALKILRKLQGERVEILKGQCLYYIGNYKSAYEVLRKFGTTDEHAVNLSAIEALNKCSSSGKTGLFVYRPEREIESLEKYKFNNAECMMEYEFNMGFKHIDDEEKYVAYLHKLKEKYPNIENSYHEKQLAIINNAPIDNLTNQQKQVFMFNTQPGYEIKNPVHFQNNFCGTERTEYKTMINNDGLKNKRLCFTKNLIMQRVVSHLTKNIKSNVIEWAIKRLEDIKDVDTKNEIEMLKILQMEEGEVSKNHLLTLIEKTNKS